jgi:hypothetical protein
VGFALPSLPLTLSVAPRCAVARHPRAPQRIHPISQIVLDDVTEYDYSGEGGADAGVPAGQPRKTKLDSILLSGTHVTMLVPGSSPEEAAAGAAAGGIGAPAR